MTFLKRLAIIVLTWPFLILLNVVLFLAGLIVVAVALAVKADMTKLWLWGNPNGLEWWKGSPYWWYAIRNPVNKLRLWFNEPEFVTLGDADPDASDGFHWRYRYGGLMDGLRVTWGKRGENEIYIGWKLNGDSVEGTAFTTQVRPLWLILIPLLIWALFGYRFN